MRHPSFLVIEGIDGSGKTTQSMRVAETLRAKDVPVTLTTEPTHSRIGSVLRRLLMEDCISEWTALHLFAADRCDHLDTLVKPALLQGDMVICDRYVLSTLAYQATSTDGPSLEEAWRVHAHFRAPDLTIFLDVPVPTAMERILSRGEETTDRYENESRLDTIHKGYRKAMRVLTRFGHRFSVLDGTGDEEDVTARILEAIHSE